MVKSELIQKLCNLHPNILRKDIAKTVDVIFNEISEALKNNMKYEIRGYGIFKVKSRIGTSDLRLCIILSLI